MRYPYLKSIFFLLMGTFGLTACMSTKTSVKQSSCHSDVCSVKLSDRPISAAFPYEKKFADVNGSKMAYVDHGEGPVVLFVHGNPTSSYLWRNIIPYVSDDHRAIAVDLIGMGDSDKPNIDYTFVDHAAYLDAFIAELDLTNITLVVHDWGSALGMRYARLNESNVKAVAFMEALLPPALPFPNYDALGPGGDMFRMLNTPSVGEGMVFENNFFIEVFLGSATSREFTAAEMTAYRAPFITPISRKPTLAWPREIPFLDRTTTASAEIIANGAWLSDTKIEKLLFFIEAGGITNADIIEYYKNNLSHLKTVNLGQGSHFIQEESPHEIGEALAIWLSVIGE